jgi:transcriptional regulator with XRE-family HTH domain
MENKEKFLKLVSDEKTDTLEKNEYRIKNREMLRYSQYIALKVLDKMGKENISKKKLARMLKIDDVEVSYILSGKENLTLKTILDIQNILNIPLLNKNDIL